MSVKKLCVVCEVVVKFPNKSVVDQVALRVYPQSTVPFTFSFQHYFTYTRYFSSCASWRGNPQTYIYIYIYIYMLFRISESTRQTDRYYTPLSSKGSYRAQGSTRVSHCVSVQFGVTVVTSEHWHVEPLPFLVHGLIQFINLTSVFQNSANKWTKTLSVLIVLSNGNMPLCCCV